MKIEKYQGTEERKILSAMICSRKVLARTTAHWCREGLFASPWANVVGGWCADYFKRYDDAPLRGIEGLFASWAQGADDATVGLVESFLQSLSEEYEETAKNLNEDAIIDQAGIYFSKIKKKKLVDKVSGLIDRGLLEEADEAIKSYKKIEMGLNSGIDVLLDEESIREALDESKQETLIQYPGDLGKFFGDSLSRDNFISFEGPEKKGKTFLLLDIAWRGMLGRRNVAFFEIGDMTKTQIFKRFIVRAARRPLKAKPIKYPTSLEKISDTEYKVEYEEKEFKTKLSRKRAKESFIRVMNDKLKSKRSFLKLYVAPAGSMSVEMISQVLESWRVDGFQTDIVVIDYADLIKSPNKGMTDAREKINDIWMSLRALSQKEHCLVVTATQTNRASYNSNIITMEHSSEDKRKMAHVTGMIGLNQSSAEKAQQLMRLNWVALREEDSNPQKCVTIAQCLAVANPTVRSVF